VTSRAEFRSGLGHSFLVWGHHVHCNLRSPFSLRSKPCRDERTLNRLHNVVPSVQPSGQRDVTRRVPRRSRRSLGRSTDLCAEVIAQVRSACRAGHIASTGATYRPRGLHIGRSLEGYSNAAAERVPRANPHAASGDRRRAVGGEPAAAHVVDPGHHRESADMLIPRSKSPCTIPGGRASRRANLPGSHDHESPFRPPDTS